MSVINAFGITFLGANTLRPPRGLAHAQTFERILAPRPSQPYQRNHRWCKTLKELRLFNLFLRGVCFSHTKPQENRNSSTNQIDVTCFHWDKKANNCQK